MPAIIAVAARVYGTHVTPGQAPVSFRRGSGLSLESTGRRVRVDLYSVVCVRDRALRDDPYYSMAHLLRQDIDSGAPQAVARLPMTPRRSLPATTISKTTCRRRHGRQFGQVEYGVEDGEGPAHRWECTGGDARHNAADRVTATGTARNVGDAQVAGRQPRNCASRGQRLTGSPVTESNLGLRAPAQRNRSAWRERFRGPAGSLLVIWMFCERTRRAGAGRTARGSDRLRRLQWRSWDGSSSCAARPDRESPRSRGSWSGRE